MTGAGEPTSQSPEDCTEPLETSGWNKVVLGKSCRRGVTGDPIAERG
mgnify:CR=1 FL=1